MNHPGCGGREILLSLVVFIVLVGVLFPGVTFGGRTVSSAPHIPFTLPSGPTGIERGVRIPLADAHGPGWTHEANFPFVRRALASGSFPLWHPHEGCGNPYFAGLLPGMLFPTNALKFIGVPPLGFDLAYLARLVLAGWLMYLFLRAHRLTIPAAGIGGVLYLGCGYMVGGMNLSNVAVEAMIPGLFLALERLLTRGRKRDVVLTVCMVFLVAVGGNPEAMFLALLLGGFYALARILSRPRSTWLRGTGLYLATHLLGGMLAAPQLLPFLEFVSHAAHAHEPGHDFGTMPWQTLIVWIVPGFYRHIYLNAEMAPSGGFYGLATLGWVAVMAGVLRRSHSFLRLFSVIALIVLAVAYFGFPGISRLNQLPIFNQIDLSKYLAIYLCLFPAVLAAIGVDNLMRMTAKKSGCLLARSATVVGAAAVGFVLFWHLGWLQDSDSLLSRTAPDQPVVPDLGLLPWIGVAILGIGLLQVSRPRVKTSLQALLALLILAEVAYHVPHEYPERREIYRPPSFLQAITGDRRTFRIFSPDPVLCANTAGIFGLNDIRHLEPLMIDSYVSLIREGFSYPQAHCYFPFESRPGVPLHVLTLLGVRHVLSVGELIPCGNPPLFSGEQHDITVDSTSCDYDLVGTVKFDPGQNGRMSVWLNEARTARIAEQAVFTEKHRWQSVRLRLNAPLGTGPAHVGFLVPDNTSLEVEALQWNGHQIEPERLRAASFFSDAIQTGVPMLIMDSTVSPLPAVRPGSEPELVIRARTTGDPVRVALATQKSRLLHHYPERRPDRRRPGVGPGPDGSRRVQRFRLSLDAVTGRSAQLGIRISGGATLLSLGLVPADLRDNGCFGDIRAYEHANPLPRAFGVYRVEVEADGDEQLRKLLDPAFPVRTTVLLRALPRDFVLPASPPLKAPDITWVEEAPSGSSVVLQVRFEAPGLLVLHDNCFPGWYARVDGKPAALLRANHCFRAAEVPAGTHRVEFYYSPPWLWIGLGVAAAAVVGLLLLLLLMWRPGAAAFRCRGHAFRLRQ